MGKSKLKDTESPVAKRKTVLTLENRRGEVVALDNANFGIRPDDGGAVLLPVNLPGELKKNGTMIRFSGEVKEAALNELWAGQLFLLSDVQKM
jgi:hypothetical protein